MSGLRSGTRLGTARLHFTFDGRRYEAQAGDTAASALLASGVRALGRSMKTRRLRGVLTAGPEEPCALLTVGTPPAVIPNACAPQLRLREGMALRSQNRWPSLRWDLAAVLQAGGGFFGAGFYYKTFMWPSWRAYEPLIRRLAGLGAAPGRCDLAPPAVEHCACDVLVAGAGAAGLAAALAAARAGARVIVCEREPQAGGELEFECGHIGQEAARDWTGAALEELARLGARVLTDTPVVGGSDGQFVALSQAPGQDGGGTLRHIRPRAFVMALGSVERGIAFVDNDKPGVMLLGAAERYLARYGTCVGRELVLFGCHDRLYASAARLRAGGMRVRAIVDTRSAVDVDAAPEVRAARAALRAAGVECLCAHAVAAACGGRRVRAVRVVPLPPGPPSPSTAASPAVPRGRRIACDALLVSGGWSPELHAGLQEGGVRHFCEVPGSYVAGAQPQGRFVAGAGNGHLELAAVLADGHAAGLRAAAAAGAAAVPGPAPGAQGDGPPRWAPFWRAPAAAADEKRQFVDLQNDVTVADLRQALDEGLRDIEHVKRYTTLGMGTEQGRTSLLLGAAVLAELKGEPLGEVGLPRSRPPYQPVPLRMIAGLRTGAAFRVARRTPLHDWHVAHGGVLDPMGLWLRPRYYHAHGADAFAAAVAEAACVRERGGIVDASTLGKIEVAGAGAADFLDSLYLTRAGTIVPGRARYLLSMREDGHALDDGIVLRLAADRFLATTSTGHAGELLAHFEFHRDTAWSGRAVAVTDVTEAWAVIGVAGPRSRAALQAALGPDWQARIAGLGYMHFVRGSWAGQDLTVLRAGYSGELAFELHCRPAASLALWEACAAQGLAPYGIDALDILRVEKGYLSASEINGQTTPLDLGLAAQIKPGQDFPGRELLGRPAFHEPQRPCLVGLRAADGRSRFLAGAQLTTGTAAPPVRPCGYVTSAVFSPALGEWVGLALLARDQASSGAVVIARDPLRHGDTPVRVTAPAHFDPAGDRMRA
jgi:sarcosine oxidase subunit alpha